MTKPCSVATSLVTVGLLLLGACSTSSSPRTQASGPDTPVAGAVAPPTQAAAESPMGNATASASINSDNKPVATRSGLGSDPSNPSGAPGHLSN